MASKGKVNIIRLIDQASRLYSTDSKRRQKFAESLMNRFENELGVAFSEEERLKVNYSYQVMQKIQNGRK